MLTKILIADPSEEFRFVLSLALGKEYTVLSCATGQQALALLRSEHPDFFVMDMMLPGIDGLSLLGTARAEQVCPPTLVTSRFFQDHIISALQKQNVVYLMSKPCELDAMVGRIQDLVAEFSPRIFFQPAPRSAVTAALFELGIPAKRVGYGNCREAVLLLKENPGALLSKEVYPAIAKVQHSSAGSVEKNIRDAITYAYDRRNNAVWARYFSTAPNGQIPKPTNRVFLSTLAEILFTMEQNEVIG